ncbi:hypothetical protein AU476_13010 [Cupriavidus sp. UYMSc13B]|nr:hypothetical protein AU476_13010 [Cupriavidus sp. UYMSc13B]
MSPRNSRARQDLAHHGFDLTQRLHEALVVRAPWLLDGEVPPSDKPSEHAPGRGNRHHAYGLQDKRRLAQRKEEADHATLHGGATSQVTSLLEFLPDQFRKATALDDSFLDIVAIGIQRRRTPRLGCALGESPPSDELAHGSLVN